MKLNKYIDHTKLGANVTKAQIDQLISEAKTYDFKSVCVNPIFVKYAKEALKDTDVLVCTVIGFPHGTHTTAVKIFETQDALNNGADEIDMVINIFDLKNDPLKVYEEIKALKDVCGQKVLKVIIETCYLTPEEIIKASELVVKAGADFVKTSTGFGTGGATIENVKLLKETVSNKAEVKASGGVRTYEQAMAMIDAGATRIGTSNGIDIILQRRKDNDSNTSY